MLLISALKSQAQSIGNEVFGNKQQIELDSLFTLIVSNTRDKLPYGKEVTSRYIELRILKYASIPKRFDNVRDSLQTGGFIPTDSLKTFFVGSLNAEYDPNTKKAFKRLWENEKNRGYLIGLSGFSISYGYEEQLPVARLLSKWIQKDDFRYVINGITSDPINNDFAIALHVFAALYSSKEYNQILREKILSIPNLADGYIQDINLFFLNE